MNTPVSPSATVAALLMDTVGVPSWMVRVAVLAEGSNADRGRRTGVQGERELLVASQLAVKDVDRERRRGLAASKGT